MNSSSLLKVRDVRMISDRNSRRSKGIAYVEFVEATSVPLAIGLTGQRVLGVPIIVQASQVCIIAYVYSATVSASHL